MTFDAFAAMSEGLAPEPWFERLRQLPHPRVFVDRAALDRVREKAGRPGWLADQVQALRTEAEHLPPSALPQRVNGHGHEFFSETGSLLLPLPDGTGGVCPETGRHYVGERYAEGAAWYVHTGAVHAALVLAALYSLTSEPAYAAAAAEVLRQFAGLFRAHGRTCRQNLDEAWRLSALAFAYDQIHDAVGEDARREIEGDLIRAAAERVLAGHDPRGNWGFCHDAGLGVAGAVLGEPRYLQAAIGGFLRRSETYFRPDGLGEEGSIGTYHMMSVSNMVTLAEALRPAGLDLYAARRDGGAGDRPRILEAVLDAPIGLAFGDGRFPALHDGWYLNGAMLNPDLYEIGYARYGKPLYRVAADALYRVDRFQGEDLGEVAGAPREQRPWWGNPRVLPSCPWVWDYYVRSVFVTPDQWLTAPARHFPPRAFWRELCGAADGPALPPADPEVFRPPSTHFPDAGLVAMRGERGDACVSFDYGPHGGGHGHLDKGGIVLYAHGRVLAPDYGTPAYGLRISGRWYKRTISHNTVMVDALDQAPCQGAALHVDLTGDRPTAVAALDAAYPGIRWRRQVSMAEGLVLVADALESEAEHTFDWLLRGRGALTVPPAAVPGEGGDGPGPDTTYMRDVRWYHTGPTGGLSWLDADGVGLALWWQVSDPARLLTADTPGFPVERPSPMIALRLRGRTARYAVLLEPFRGAPRVAGFRVGGGEGEITLATGRVLRGPLMV